MHPDIWQIIRVEASFISVSEVFAAEQKGMSKIVVI